MATEENSVLIDTVKVVFKVRACVREKEEVRITGNIPSLGTWDIFSSVKLNKSIESNDVWFVEVCVPLQCSLVQYRYMVVSGNPGEGGFKINSWETFPHPREHNLARAVESNSIQTVKEEYGITKEGQRYIDDGWLVGTSELHLQLGTLGKALSISDHPPHTHYLFTLTPFTQAHTQTVNCSPLKAKLCSRSKGDCLTFDLGTGGCPYDQSDNLVIFTTESVDFQHTGFIIDVFRVSEQCDQSSLSLPVSLPPASSRVGRASLLPQHYLGESRGSVVLTLFSHELLPVGTLSLCFLLISPVSELPLLHSTKHAYSNYWRQHQRMLHIGHRGLGDSHHSQLKATETENTIASFKMAGTHGADYVEFDVHLTRDQVCVVYHNFLVATTLAREGFFSGELYAMAVKDLTLSQLQSLKLENSNGSGNKVKIPCHCSSKRCCSNNELGCVKCTNQYKDARTALFPSLETIFQSVPTSLGFNIEVKYPLPERAKDGSVGEDYSCFDINLMADIILRVVDQHAGERAVIFSCFNPDMCTVLHRKQSKYPVMFLTSCLNPIYDDPLDYRAHTLRDAMMHASAEKLPYCRGLNHCAYTDRGIVADSYAFVDRADLVREVKERGFVLFTWGDTNNSSANIEAQDKAGVDAIICDCIDQLIPRGSTSDEK